MLGVWILLVINPFAMVVFFGLNSRRVGKVCRGHGVQKKCRRIYYADIIKKFNEVVGSEEQRVATVQTAAFVHQWTTNVEKLLAALFVDPTSHPIEARSVIFYGRVLGPPMLCAAGPVRPSAAHQNPKVSLFEQIEHFPPPSIFRLCLSAFSSERTNREFCPFLGDDYTPPHVVTL